MDPGIVLSAPFDVVLADDTVVEPDLLAVEILSPATRGRDQVRKKQLYETAGVPSYWIVDPDGPSLTAWELRDGRYVAVAAIAGDEQWTATEPLAVTIRPGDLVVPAIWRGGNSPAPVGRRAPA